MKLESAPYELSSSRSENFGKNKFTHKRLGIEISDLSTQEEYGDEHWSIFLVATRNGVWTKKEVSTSSGRWILEIDFKDHEGLKVE